MTKIYLKEKQSREEIVFGLAAHIRSTSPIPYHEIIKWPTEVLRRMLAWYEKPDDTVHVGIDRSKGDDKTVVSVFLWPVGYKVAESKKMPTI